MGALIGLLTGIGFVFIGWAVVEPAWTPKPRGTKAHRLDDLLARAGLSEISPRGLLGVSTASFLLVTVVMAAFSGVLVVAVVFGLLAAMLPIAMLRGRATRRSREFAMLWPDAVDNLASAVRAGLSLPEALQQLGERGPEGLRGPFEAFARDYQSTGRFHESLDRLKVRLADPVGDRVVEALRIARDVGGGDLGRIRHVVFVQMFVSRIRMQQDQSVKALFRSIPARTLSNLFVSLLVLLFATAGPASADAPLEVNSPITDNAKVLGTDHARVDTALEAFTRKTGLHLYVVYVANFNGLTGTDWAEKTAAQSAIGSTDILLAISTGDNEYGVAEPSTHAISNTEFNTVAVSDIRPTVDARDWAGAAIDAAQGYEKASEASGLPWTFIVTGALLIALVGALGVHRTRLRYDETHVIRDQHGQPVDPFELLDTDELIDKAQLSVAGVEDPELKIQLGRQLSDLLSTSLRRTDNTRRALAIDIIHLSLNLGRTATADTENIGRRS